MFALNALQVDELPVLHRRNHSITSSARMRSSHVWHQVGGDEIISPLPISLVEGIGRRDIGFRSSGIAEAHLVACERGMMRSR